MSKPVSIDAEVVRRYDRSGPRYTSYPPATEFHPGFTEARYRAHAAASNRGQAPRPLSLYVHIPFCATVCYYCACNRIVTANRARAAPYVTALERELELQARLYREDRTVEQLHWGGGTPTFLDNGQMQRLMAATRRHFALRDDDAGEYSIEIDPRSVAPEDMAVLRELGFNRVSFGVQDFDTGVQQAVNRIQSEEQTLGVMAAARESGFHSVSIDLIYGLPRQSPQSFAATLEKVVRARPDRLSVFSYAHLPARFKTQRRIDEAELPPPAQKLEILTLTIETLQRAGYVYIGMDHFALPGDDLARALDDGTLHRNFQGFSTRAGCDLVGLGVSAIGKLERCYVQNERTTAQYYACLDEGRLAVARGVELDDDDCLRREVISSLICRGRVEKQAIAGDFDARFADARGALERMRRDGLIREDDSAIEVLPAGRVLIRNVCMAFDVYIGSGQSAQRFSRAI